MSAPLNVPPGEPPRPTGVFIVMEGGEGSGKSTQVALLADAVAAAGRFPLITREPGGSPRAEAIRELILADGDSQIMDPRTEALLFAAARADHASHVIRPALQRGEVVICDRYIDSSVAYQGVARGLDADRIRELSSWATQTLLPDLTILLDIHPELGLARASDANRLEREPMAFHRAVRDAYLSFAAADPGGYAVVSAEQDAAAVQEQVWAAVGELMETT